MGWCVVGVLGVLVVKRIFFEDTPVAPPPDLLEVTKKPVELRDFTREDLRRFNGSEESNGAVYIGCKGKVYDVSSRKEFYGPGGPYHAFAGRDASRALAKNSTLPEVADNPSLEGLTATELEQLEEWETLFESKYNIIGRIIVEESIPPNNS
uniref:Cytochrome b5 heme-binding domain-containing protein n=1 Tax=Arcella intermedia TaxID=1963864 RepID=A0A6B2LPE4_9EUKA